MLTQTSCWIPWARTTYLVPKGFQRLILIKCLSIIPVMRLRPGSFLRFQRPWLRLMNYILYINYCFYFFFFFLDFSNFPFEISRVIPQKMLKNHPEIVIYFLLNAYAFKICFHLFVSAVIVYICCFKYLTSSFFSQGI